MSNTKKQKGNATPEKSNLNVYLGQYQIHLPDPNSATDGTADVYRNRPH
jgi:hypothetical protein